MASSPALAFVRFLDPESVDAAGDCESLESLDSIENFSVLMTTAGVCERRDTACDNLQSTSITWNIFGGLGSEGRMK